jgi:hypothetical protein
LIPLLAEHKTTLRVAYPYENVGFRQTAVSGPNGNNSKLAAQLHMNTEIQLWERYFEGYSLPTPTILKPGNHDLVLLDIMEKIVYLRLQHS